MDNDRSEQNMHAEVQRYYGETLESTGDLKTTACCTVAAPPPRISAFLNDIHPEVASRYYGCGLILPEALEGLRVLDLGCGAGRDVYLLSRLVGAEGHVTGVDMTTGQLAVAREHVDYHTRLYGYSEPNVDFIEGNIEALEQAGLEPGSYDLIVSNCVINLAVNKSAVLNAAFDLLKPGGELYFADIYSSRRVPAELRSDPVLYGECLSGALYWNDFLGLAEQAGFAPPLLIDDVAVEVTDAALTDRIDGICFCSATVRLFKVAGLEATEEDYGQRAIYSGAIAEHPDEFRLDRLRVFPVGQEVGVSGNTARLLNGSRFSESFEILGDFSNHLGQFDDKSVLLDFSAGAGAAQGSACC